MKQTILTIFSLTAISLSVALSGCADRKDLETPAPVPVITNNPGTPGGAVPGGSCNNPDGPPSTAYCAPNAKGVYPKDNLIVTTGMNSDGSAWAKGGGCVLRPIREVWAVFNNYNVMDVLGADSYSIDHPNININSTITNFYQLTYKHTAFGIFTVHWTLQWFDGVSTGTFEAPQVVQIIYQRVSGTSHIPVWNGKIILAKLNDTTTSFYIHNNFKATQSENDNIGSAHDAMVDWVNKARTFAPDWNNLNNHK